MYVDTKGWHMSLQPVLWKLATEAGFDNLAHYLNCEISFPDSVLCKLDFSDSKDELYFRLKWGNNEKISFY